MSRFLHPFTLVMAAWLTGFSPLGWTSPVIPQPISQPTAAAALQAFTLRYHARYMGFAGQATLTLQAAQNQQWRYTLQVQHALASLTQSTLFDEQNVDGRTILRPLENRSVTKIPFRHRSVQAHYDWHARQATWTGDAKPSRRGPVALEPGDLDGLLVNLAVVRDLAHHQALRYRMVDGGRAVTLTYQVIEPEIMNLNGKPVTAIRIERDEHKNNKQQIAWVVAGIPAPVRLLQRENGKDMLELVLATNSQ